MMNGLTEEEAATRLARYGKNSLPEVAPPAVWRVFVRQFLSPLIYVLLAAALVSLVVGEERDAAFIFVVLLLNAVIGAGQEYSAERAAQSLKSLVPLHARVCREGKVQEISAEQLVPGDTVMLETGDKVPADIALLTAENFYTDESLLTGESVAVEKKAGKDVACAGTMVTRGRAHGEVTATGKSTELGRIASSLAAERLVKPPLMIRLERFTLNITFFILAVIAVIFAVTLATGGELKEMFLLAVALAVAVIPEGLPAAITIVLALGMRRMVAHGVIVRKLLAVEALGSCTFIASDKTGTLTVNELTVRKIVLADGSYYDVTGEGQSLEGKILTEQGSPAVSGVTELALAGALANEACHNEGDFSGDAVDIAFLVLAEKCGLTQTELRRNYPETACIPYESASGYAASVRTTPEGGAVTYAKGSAEAILPRCNLSPDATEQAHTAMQTLAENGYRVLAVACGASMDTLTFLGLVGMIDPLRSEAREAVLRAREAGIEVAMITGDHPATALAIARDLGLAEDASEVITGAAIEASIAKGGEALRDAVRNKRVFARVAPAQKQEIVKALAEAGHFVAMTGDGVNDAPALRASHVGVAMGRRGTDAARESSDLILTDDDFSSIVSGIREGRVIYANIRKIIFLLVSTGAAELVLFLLSLIAGLPMPLLAVQLLWLNLATQSIQHMTLAVEPAEGDELQRPPRSVSEAIFNHSMLMRVAISGVYIGGVACGVFWGLLEMGRSLDEARNLTLLLMVIFENVQLLAARSEYRSVFAMNPLRNLYALLSVLGAQGMHVGAIYLPGLNDTLSLQPFTLYEWGCLALLALSLLLVDAACKNLPKRENP